MPGSAALGAALAKGVEAVKKVEKVASKIDKGEKAVEKATSQKDSNWSTGQLKGIVKKGLSDSINEYFKNSDEGEHNTDKSDTNNPTSDTQNKQGNMSSNINEFKPNIEMNEKGDIIIIDNEEFETELSSNTLLDMLNDYFDSIDRSDCLTKEKFKSDLNVNEDNIEVKEQYNDYIDDQEKQNDDSNENENTDKANKKQESAESIEKNSEKNRKSDSSDGSNKHKKDIKSPNSNSEINKNNEKTKSDVNSSKKSNNADISNKDVKENDLRDLTDEEKEKLRKAGMSDENIGRCKIDKNGKIYLKTINSSYEGKPHPETGVKYVRKTIILNGIEIEGVFPEFDSIFECELPKELLFASDDEQFSECMRQLKEAINKDPKLASQFSEKQLERIMNKDVPRVPGFIWHHNEVTGKMELVKGFEHEKSSHTGGRTIWGGGQGNRIRRN